MTSRGLRARSGITLTEILIAILIMGVGLISLATLFPLGLLRLREASRNSRGALTLETAADDTDTRGLLYKPYFAQTWYGPRDPFTQDALSDGSYNVANKANAGVIACANSPLTSNNVGLLTGLPFCYDPLWRDITNVVPNNTGVASAGLYNNTLAFALAAPYTASEARFGDGMLNGTQPYLRNDPDKSAPSAYGIQRITNFIPWNSAGLTSQYPFTTNLPGQTPADVAANIFTSIDDIVFNPFSGNATAPSSVLPDMSLGVPQADYKYTWFITGRQTDAGGNGTQFTGEIVVCDGRQFGFDPLPGTTTNAPAGEGVYEAIFGLGKSASIIPLVAGGTVGLAVNDRSVLLRWPAGQADPQVRVGGWICDVTYERNTATYISRLKDGTSLVRCNWYQVTKRTDPQVDTVIAASGYRQMVLTVSSPLKAKTLLNIDPGKADDGTPVHVNVALVMPSVINVFPRSFEVH